MGTGPVGVGQVQAGLAVLNSTDVTGLPDEQVRSEVLDLLTCLNQLTGALLSRIAAFDRRDLAHADAQRASSTWLVDFGRISKGAALRWLTHARHLTQLPALAAGMRAGTVSAEQLGRIADLVRHIGIDRVRDYDHILAHLCANAGPVEVARACERIWALVDPDGAEPDPQADLDRREITFSQLGTMLYIRGRLDPDGAAALQTAVDALMRPPTAGDQRSAAQRRADAMIDLARAALANGDLPQVGGQRPQVGILITPDILFDTPAPDPTATGCPHTTTDTTDDDGEADHCEYDRPHQTVAGAAADTSPTGSVPRPGMPTSGRPEAASSPCDCDPLTRAGVPPSPERPWLNWVGEVTPHLARRLACDGTIWRLVLDPRTGLPLDVGRKIRIVPWWMRKALRARDRTCRFPGCDTPSDWTDTHHLTPWWQGGITAVEQAVSLCRYHHSLVHEGRWTLRMDHTTGEVWASRPDGTPYELGPSQPWTSPSRHGPQPTTPPSRAKPPNTADPPWPTAA